MPKSHFTCIHHFRNVVTTSAGNPTCRECGLGPTDAESENLQALQDWDKARLRASLTASRKLSQRRGK